MMNYVTLDFIFNNESKSSEFRRRSIQPVIIYRTWKIFWLDLYSFVIRFMARQCIVIGPKVQHPFSICDFPGLYGFREIL
jgi:hypothetical protein